MSFFNRDSWNINRVFSMIINASFIYQQMLSTNAEFTNIKVKDIRKYMFEVYTNDLFNLIDLEELVKNEIETKAIIVIDEIDKLVRGVSYSFLFALS